MDSENVLSSKVIELLLYTRKASETQSGAFGLKERLLFCLLQGPQPPRELMERLCMVKTNLALLANKCIKEELIEKVQRGGGDKRTLLYKITDKGAEQIGSRLGEIERKFNTVISDDGERAKTEEDLDSAIELLSYLP